MLCYIWVLGQVSYVVREGDKVSCTIAELQQLRAEPQEIPLDIVYEDEHLLVVNKPAHMVILSLFFSPNASFVLGLRLWGENDLVGITTWLSYLVF